MDSPKDVTIYDIAKNLDVSPSTVSRALNDDPTVSKKTRKKIFDTATQMGYRSNPFAKSLRQQQSLTIGVLVYELSNSFMTSALIGIEKVANEAGYGIIIMDAAQNHEKEIANAQSLFHRRVDGIIAFPASNATGMDHFKPFAEKNIPVIFLDRSVYDDEYTTVAIDNTACARMAVRHLIDQGCRRIAHLTPSINDDMYALRYIGHRGAMTENELPFDDQLLLTAPITEEDSILAAEKIMKLQPMPDGLFATSDLAAAVCIRTFLDNGIRVPQDIAVVGFNNDIIAKRISPGLTTISYPAKQLGETAARNIVNHLKGIGNMHNINTMTLRAELIVRQSSLKNS